MYQYSDPQKFEISEKDINAKEYIDAYLAGKFAIVYFAKGEKWVVKYLLDEVGVEVDSESEALDLAEKIKNQNPQKNSKIYNISD